MYDDYQTIQKEMTDQTAQLIDVREENEWNEGHLADAISLPLSKIKAGVVSNQIDRNKKTYLHCRSGRRVLEAEPLLEQLGFNEVIPLESGYEILVEEGFKNQAN